MLNRMARAFLCLTIIFGATSYCFAQATGNIKGAVADPNGGLVAGATVEAVNAQTGEKRSTTTSDAGTYNITNLPVGIYTLTATATGFGPGTAKDVQVSVAFTTEANISLPVGGASATVTVSSATDVSTQINTNDQQLSTLIDNKKIMDLPLLSRDPNGLILLAPGVTQTQTGLGGFSVNGQRERNNNFLVDGIDNNDADVPGIAGGAATPNIDATQEFRVLTSQFNAEFGRNTGAIINVATKNGTNDFHGGAYMYYRSQRFAARNFFDAEKQPLQRKQFGGSIGGPIKKDKAFFFFNYEGDRSLSSTTENRTVPSALARQGIFVTPQFGTLDVRQAGANNRSQAGICEVIGAEPADCPGALPGGNLGINPGLRQFLNLYPLGNVPGQGPLPGVFDLFRFSAPNRFEVDTTASRVDWKLTEKHSLTGSFNTSNGEFDLFPETFPGSGDGSRTPQKSYVLSLNLTSTLTPNIVNEVRFGGNRIEAIFNGPGDGGAGRAPYDAILAAFQTGGIDTHIQPFGGPNGELVSLTGGTITGFGAFDTQFRFTGTTVLGDNLTWVKGAHTFRGGFEQRWIYSNGASNFGRSETVNFNTAQFGGSFLQDNAGNPIPTTGVGGQLQNFASLLYGFFGVQSQSQFFNKDQTRVDQDYRGYRVRESGIYFQDTWRVRPNLTLNYGLRWDYNAVPYEVNGQMSTLVDQNPSGPQPAGGFEFKLVGKNSANPNLKLWDNDYNNFGPRFGFNYSPGWDSGWISKLTGGPTKTSIRGGYGIFYDRVFTNLFGNSSANPPFQRDFQFLFDFLGPTGFAGADNIPRAPTLETSPFAFNGDELLPVIFALPGNNIFQSKFATPYTQSWNFGFQRELGNLFLFEADYVGSHGVDLLRNISGALPSVTRVNAIRNLNRQISTTSTRTNFLNGVLNTAFNPIFLNVSLGQSTFNSMQLRLTKTLTNKDLGTGQIQVVYAWSHSIDDSADALVPGSGPGGASERALPRDSSGFAGGFSAPERGNSGFDVRHRLVLNFIYDLPVRFENRTLDRFLGNWTMSGIVQSQTGLPYSIFGGIDSAGTGLGQRADFAPSGQGLSDLAAATTDPRTYTGLARSLFRNPCPANRTNTSPTACSPAVGPAVGRQGSVGRNQFYGPAFNKVDFSVIKRFPVTENTRFTIRADFFNIFNTVNFGLPGNDINSQLFGQSTTAGSPRIIQFAGRFDF
jgi:carboxypeptidase family protein